MTVDEMEITVAEFYRRTNDEFRWGTGAGHRLAGYLRRVEAAQNGDSGAQFLHQQRKAVVDKVAYWTGAQRPLIKKLIEVIEKRIGELDLFADTGREPEH